jgi:hypothetical protein
MRIVSRTLFSVVQRFPQLIRRAWSRDYQDVRLILEQGGDLKYFNIQPSPLRKIARRGLPRADQQFG